MSENAELHVSPSEIVKMSGLSPYNSRRLVMDLIEPRFQSGKFKFYLREEVEQFLELHAPILSLFSKKDDIKESELETAEPVGDPN